MAEWAVAAVLFLALLWAIVVLLPRAKRSALKGGGRGFAIALGMIFASAFDPARAAAVEEVDRRKETGDSEDGESGTPPG
jgi:hypothetical protein